MMNDAGELCLMCSSVHKIICKCKSTWRQVMPYQHTTKILILQAPNP